MDRGVKISLPTIGLQKHKLGLGAMAIAAVTVSGWAVHGRQRNDPTHIPYLRCEPTFAQTSVDHKYREIVLKSAIGYPYGLASTDYDGDRRTDLTIADGDTGRLHILLNRGVDQFEEQIRETDLSLIERHAHGKIEEGGKLTTVIVDNRKGGIFALTDDQLAPIAPAGTFKRAYDVALADFNRDGHTDVLATNYVGNEVRLFWNPGSLGEPWPTTLASDIGAEARTARVADFDGDGDPDALTTSRLSMLVSWLENADGQWLRHEIDGSIPFPAHSEPADMDGDGDIDIVLAAGLNADPKRGQQCVSGILLV